VGLPFLPIRDIVTDQTRPRLHQIVGPDTASPRGAWNARFDALFGTILHLHAARKLPADKLEADVSLDRDKVFGVAGDQVSAHPPCSQGNQNTEMDFSGLVNVVSSLGG
jgi:hypothetical protein